jgi:hypothetical protein
MLFKLLLHQLDLLFTIMVRHSGILVHMLHKLATSSLRGGSNLLHNSQLHRSNPHSGIKDMEVLRLELDTLNLQWIYQRFSFYLIWLELQVALLAS